MIWKSLPRSSTPSPPPQRSFRLKSPLAYVWPERRTITEAELIYGWNEADGVHVSGLDDVVKIPGLTNAWTMPIKTRIDMLSTGIKTPIGIKVGGSDLKTLAELSGKIASQLRTLPDTVSVYSEKTVGGYYVDFKVKRAEAARYGMNVQDVQDVILTALGGMNVTTTVEGLERYPVNVRYPRELRDDLTKLKRTLIAAPSGAQIPIEQVAELVVHTGPPVIRSEQARPNAWIYVDISTSDIGGYVRRAQELVQQNVIDRPHFPTGYSVTWSGQYEYMQQANQRLLLVVPITLVIIILLLYISTRSIFRTLVILMAVPFSLVGAIWFLYLLAGLQLEPGGVGGHDRAGWRGRRDRRGDAPLPRRGVQQVPPRGKDAQSPRPGVGDPRRCRQAHPPQDNDRHGPVLGAHAHDDRLGGWR